MNAALIFSGSGPLVVLTSREGHEDHRLPQRLERKAITKFIRFPVAGDGE